MALNNNALQILLLIILIIISVVTVVIIIFAPTPNLQHYESECAVNFTTTQELTINKQLTNMQDPHFENLAYAILPTDGEYSQAVKYGWTQDTGQKGPSFDVYYNVYEYENMLIKIHTHCYDGFSDHGVKSMNYEFVGQQGILFSGSTKIKESSGIDTGYFKIEGPGTGFFLAVTDVNNLGTFEKVYYGIGSLSGQINAEGLPISFTNVTPDTYNVNICDLNLNSCVSDEIYIDTTIAPIIECEYDPSTSSLQCSSQ